MLVRPMLASERSLVLADWKRDLADNPRERTWGRGLSSPEFWAVLDYVIDKITFPSCAVSMLCDRELPDTPLAWMAVRDGVVLHHHARGSVLRDPELAAAVERVLLSSKPVVLPAEPWNPILELKC